MWGEHAAARFDKVSIPFSSGRERSLGIFVPLGLRFVLFQSPSHRGGSAPFNNG